MLFASPDDDLDPVKPGEKYDEKIYHRFARPEQWTAKRHRVVMRAVRVDDWVTIRGCKAPVVNNPNLTDGPVQNLDGGEARVEKLVGDQAFIALAGNVGIGGSRDLGGAWAWVPVTSIYPMALPSIIPGDEVRVLRGKYAPCEGVVTDSLKGIIHIVRNDGDVIQVTIESIEKTEATTLI